MSAVGAAARGTRIRVAGLAGQGRLAGARVRGPVPAPRSAAVLLASEGRAYNAASIALAAEIAAEAGGAVQVLSLARVHGVTMGLPNPGLMPTRAEWREQEEHVRRAVTKLKRRGLVVHGQVLGTRKPAARICKLAEEVGAVAIVMGADQPRARLVGSMLWSQEPQAVARRAKIPVHLMIE